MKEVNYVAIYAAIISTITLVWNIVNSVIDRISRFGVSASFHGSIISIGNGESVKGPGSINVSVVNRSKRVKYIKSINIKLPYKTSFGNMCNLCNIDNSKPITLNPEEEYVLDFRINESAAWMFENYREGKFKIVVYDTTNKKYRSKNKKVKVLKKLYEENISIPSEVRNLIR